MTASNIYDPRIHLVRYKQLISLEENFNYAALELRFAIEAIVYKQIKSYGNNIPNQILETWQPNKSFKLLTSFDENASRSIDLAWAEGDGSEDPSALNYKSLGSQRVLTIKELDKMYNTLGSFLHLPSLKTTLSKTKEKKLNSINNIYSKLDTVSKEGNLSIRTSKLIEATCPYCDKVTILPTSILNVYNPEVHKCTSQGCRKTFTGFFDGQNVKLSKIGIQVSCPNCSHNTFIDNASISDVSSAINYDISCSRDGCNTRITFRPCIK